MKTKRPYTRAEKSLFAAPLLFVALAGGAWLWRKSAPINVDLEKATKIDGLSFSPDGKKLAVSFFRELNSPVPVQVFDLESRTKLCELETPPLMDSQDKTYGVEPLDPPTYSRPAWSPDSRKIVAGCNYILAGTTRIPYPPRADGKPAGSHPNDIARIAIWNAERGDVIRDVFYAPAVEDSRVDAVRYSRDGKRLIGSGIPPTIFDANTVKRLKVFRAGASDTVSTDINEELGLYAQTSEKDGGVRIFDTQTNQLIWASPVRVVRSAGYYDVHWFGPILAARPFEDSPQPNGLLWDGEARKPLPSPPDSNFGELNFSSDGRTVSYSHTKAMKQIRANAWEPQNEIVIWDYRANRVLWRHPIGLNTYGLQTSPDGKWFSYVELSANNEYRTLKVYDRSGHLHLEQEVGDFLTAWSPDSSEIATIAVFDRSVWKRQIVMLRVN